MDAFREELQAVKSKLFGSGAANVPPTYLELLKKRGVVERETYADFSDQTKGEFVAYWLDGELFRGIAYRGDTNNAAADELAYPLSTLSSVKTTYSFAYDDFMRRHTDWTRVVTLRFRDEEPIILHDHRAEAMADTRASQFVDSVLRAIATPRP